jgi:large subunit ribosomal protein L24
MSVKFKLKKGDEVVVLAGKDKGKSGEIIAVRREDSRVVVRGVNVVKRHQRQTQTQQAGIVEKEAPIHISNVALRDPKTKKPTRIGYQVLKDGRKVRVACASKEVIDR